MSDLRKFLSIIATLLLVFAIACGGGQETVYDDEEEDEGGEEVATATSADTAQPGAPATADAGNVSGVVKLAGTPAAMPNVAMGADPACHQQHPTPAKSNEVVVSADGGLANVFVYVRPQDVKGSYPAPKTEALLDQVGCLYKPHVHAVHVGQTLKIRNSDPTLHNVHALAKANPEFNIGQPVQGMESQKKFDKPEILIKIKCDVHGWMNSYLAVMPHPFHSVSNDGGAFNISNLPAGTYTLEAWHEKFGTQSQQITVGPNETAQVSFTFNAS
ncbi:MAG TPA: carboxypeptidase regulatory-like domain-containing protein [Thermoanaerobaculia bacterium]|nr:carboxypeptidase regulatory-like domain-containing protein [Thermoanaerobaculia bacterium]